MSRYVPHRWRSQDGDLGCMTCGLWIDKALADDEEYLAPSCPGKAQGCPGDTEGEQRGPHHLEPDGRGGAECHYCGRPDKRLAA